MRYVLVGIAMPVFALAGCAVPNVDAEVGALQQAVSAAAEPLNASLTQEAEAERLAARDAAIRAGQIVYREPVDCAFIGDGVRDGIAPTNCALDPVYPIDEGVGTAIYTAEAVAVVESYAATVVAIAGSDAAPDIQSSLAALLAASNDFSSAAGGGTPIAKARIAPISRLAGRLADRARIRALRRLVDAADVPLADALDYIVAQRDAREGLTDAAERLIGSYQTVRAARGGPTAAYAAAIAAYEAEIARFRQSAADSTYARLLLVWRTHEQLRFALDNYRVDFEVLAAVIEDIQAIRDS